MSINQILSQEKDPQVLYCGRWVNKENFRVYVYNLSSQKLANSYDEYCKLIESGIWFSTKDEIVPKQPIEIKRGRKPKYGTDG